jgi:hypothetical protein
MDGFYAYIIGPDGHVIKRVDLALEKEEDAVRRANDLVDGHDVELWQRDRRIATFKSSEPQPARMGTDD